MTVESPSDQPRCFRCKNPIVLPTSTVGRSESCPHCTADLRCCLNCTHYDPSCYNECREPQAERVLDKDRGNFCDYFSLRRGSGSAGGGDGGEGWRNAADDLFKS